MLLAFRSLEKIKNATTIYCGCGSDINTRYNHEIKNIEDTLKCFCLISNKVCIAVVVRDGSYFLRIGSKHYELTKSEFELIDRCLINC